MMTYLSMTASMSKMFDIRSVAMTTKRFTAIYIQQTLLLKEHKHSRTLFTNILRLTTSHTSQTVPTKSSINDRAVPQSLPRPMTIRTQAAKPVDLSISRLQSRQ
jgi:hypothetical protein